MYRHLRVAHTSTSASWPLTPSGIPLTISAAASSSPLACSHADMLLHIKREEGESEGDNSILMYVSHLRRVILQLLGSLQTGGQQVPP